MKKQHPLANKTTKKKNYKKKLEERNESKHRMTEKEKPNTFGIETTDEKKACGKNRWRT